MTPKCQYLFVLLPLLACSCGFLPTVELKKDAAPLPAGKSILIMIPGIRSGEVARQEQFLRNIQRFGGQEATWFFDWGGLNPGRTVVSPTATIPAAKRLNAMLARWWSEGKTVDILAHSAGTVVLNRMALLNRGPHRFRHILFLGTPHDPGVDLSALRAQSKAILNLHSSFDKINRNVSDNDGVLKDLSGGPYRNRDHSTSLGGRLVRHYVFLNDTPENWVGYGHYFRTGTWPAPASEVSPPLTVPALDALARGPRPGPAVAETVVNTALTSEDPVLKTYGAILVGQSGMQSAIPALKMLAAAKTSPVYLRTEAYQAIGNLKDPTCLQFLRLARKQDRACDEVLRDILRQWKRERIR